MNTFIADTAERSRQYRIVGVAAVLVVAVAAGVMFALNANRPQPTGSVPVGTTNAASTVVAESAQSAFSCGSSTISARQMVPTAFVDALRTGSHVGYDRMTVEFKNAQPGSISIRPQAGTTFNQSPSGMAVKVAGSHGILVVIRGADAHTAYSGLHDIKTRFSGLVEVRVLEDFEGQISLGLGVKTACYRASVLSNPVRLVIDTQS
jgi:hypothetical protein